MGSESSDKLIGALIGATFVLGGVMSLRGIYGLYPSYTQAAIVALVVLVGCTFVLLGVGMMLASVLFVGKRGDNDLT